MPGGRSTLEAVFPLLITKRLLRTAPFRQWTLPSAPHPVPVLMLPRGACVPEKHSLAPTQMGRGLMALQSMAGRHERPPERKVHSKQRSLSKSAQAVSRHYKRVVRGGRGGSHHVRAGRQRGRPPPGGGPPTGQRGPAPLLQPLPCLSHPTRTTSSNAAAPGTPALCPKRRGCAERSSCVLAAPSSAPGPRPCLTAVRAPGGKPPLTRPPGWPTAAEAH